jgi:ATP-dependent Clp protease protease subunit
MISCPITTLVTGLAASMGSILSLCASPKRRFATPNARIMIHQPAISGAVEGQATDLAIHAAEMLKARNRIIEIYAEQTGQAKETIDRAIDRDSWMNPEEAKKFGLLDGVVTSFDMIPS